MMIRTQIYLPEEVHKTLLKVAKSEKTSLSRLIREGAADVVKKRYGNKTPQQKALEFFANPPKKYRINLDGDEIVALIRKERDE